MKSANYPYFYPRSFILPEDSIEVSQKWAERRLWMVKRFAASKGEGVELVDSSVSSPPTNACIIQEYISRPLLVKSKKMDLRLYVLVTSLAPLRFYLHEFGLARLATLDYGEEIDVSERGAHLTNVSINRELEGFSAEGQKISLQELYENLSERGIDVRCLKERMERVVAITMLSAAPTIRKQHQQMILHRSSSFELFGLDVLVDEDLNCWIMEVNVSPSMSGRDSELDRFQKTEIMAELFNMVRLVDCDPDIVKPCEPLEKYDAAWRKSIIEAKGAVDWDRPSFAGMANVRDFLEEKRLVKRFKRIFPKRKTLDELLVWFKGMGYCDKSFIEWIKLKNHERLDRLNKGLEVYQSQL
jgi:tubulin polyglutamylase TTLL4